MNGKWNKKNKNSEGNVENSSYKTFIKCETYAEIKLCIRSFDVHLPIPITYES